MARVKTSDAVGSPKKKEGEEDNKKASNNEMCPDIFEEYFRLHRESQLAEEHQNWDDHNVGRVGVLACLSCSEPNCSWERDSTSHQDGDSSDYPDGGKGSYDKKKGLIQPLDRTLRSMFALVGVTFVDKYLLGHTRGVEPMGIVPKKSWAMVVGDVEKKDGDL